MERKWFVRKRYGWGWQPATWEGWTVLLLFVLSNFVNIFLVNLNSLSESAQLLELIPWIFFSGALLIGVCVIKGETPRWQWGKESGTIRSTTRKHK